MFELLDNVLGLLGGCWQVKDVLPQAEICSADLFFTDHQSGEYRFGCHKIPWIQNNLRNQ